MKGRRRFSMKRHVGKVVRVEWWDHTAGKITGAIPEGTDACAWGADLGRVHSVKDGIVVLVHSSVSNCDEGKPVEDNEYAAVIEAAIRKVTVYSGKWR